MSKATQAAQPPRGTRDLFGDEKRLHQRIIDIARDVSQHYRFQDIETPMFESTSVFHRLGESSDIVTKETYTFQDRGDHSLTLRPEGTASVARALISNGLTQDLPGKYFYAGPMFRYERPQKGRYRQFTQIGVELLGRDTYHADVEVLLMAKRFLDQIGVGKRVTLQINTLGDQESRQAYRTALVDYFTPLKGQLSAESQRRLEQNPLRILDSKDPGDQTLITDAPVFPDYLTEEAKTFFTSVCRALDALGMPYDLNPALVRGLDYYCHTAFEFISTDLGAQGTVLAGGRYNGLVKNLGGPDVSGVGWAAGVDRLAMLSSLTLEPIAPICLVPLCEAADHALMSISEQLIAKGLMCETIYGGTIGKRLKKADKLGATFAILMGDDERAENTVQVKNLESGASDTIAMSAIVEYLVTNPLNKKVSP